MANGLMGKLTLDVSGVMKSIDDLQRGLANLGKGGGNIQIPSVDALKTQLTDVSKQLTEIDSKLKNIGSGGSNVNQHASKVRELVGLYKEMMSIETKMTSLDATGGHANQINVLYDRYGELIKRIEQYSQADQQKARETDTYLKAEQKQ